MRIYITESAISLSKHTSQFTLNIKVSDGETVALKDIAKALSDAAKEIEAGEVNGNIKAGDKKIGHWHGTKTSTEVPVIKV